MQATDFNRWYLTVHDTNGAGARRAVHDFTTRHPEYAWTEIQLGVGYMVLIRGAA